MIVEAGRVTPFHRTEAEACEYIGPEGVFWSRGRTVLRSDTLDGPVSPVSVIPRPPLRRLLGLTRLGRRLARQAVHNLIPMADGSLLFTFARTAGFIRDGRVRFIGGMARPCRVLRGGCARLPDGSIAFGEYFDNPAREAVRVYRVRAGNRMAEEVHRFAPGEVRHIHSVSWDSHAARAVVAAGDIGDECRITAFDADFRSSEVLGMGSEDWRAVSPQYAPDAIYFGTDAQFEQNRLLRYDRATGALTTLAEVNGPVFYSAAVGDGWVFATTAELCPSQTSAEAILYHVAAATGQVRILARFAKDRLSRRYFQLGILNFPFVASSIGKMPVSGTALRGLDGKFVLLGDV